MEYRSKLFSLKNPYDRDTDELFFDAVRENLAFQRANCTDYRKITEGMGINEDNLKSIADLPCIPTLFFKRHALKTKPALIKATSSGTSGNFSEISYDMKGMFLAFLMAARLGARHGLISPVPCHYVLMGYKPHRGNRTAVTKTAFAATFYAPALSRNYILRYKKDGYVPDFEGIISRLVKLGGSPFPVRFMGFPSYTYFLMRIMEERGICLKLKKGSKILLGGGWKQFYARQVDKTTFYELAEKIFGVKDCDIHEFFGAVEHPILYCDCRNHHFHVPVYSRIVIRDVDTLEVLPMGKIGLINLVTPLVEATPILSVMTDDLGVLHPGSKCGCGIETPYLEVIGRVAPDDIKTCAAGAADLLKGIKLPPL